MPAVGWADHKDYFTSVDLAIKYLRSIGIDGAIFNTWQGVLSQTAEDVEQANAEALEIAEKSDGFLYPGASMNPQNPQISLKWLEIFYEHGYRWAGELLTYNLKKECKYTDPSFLKLVKRCAELGFIVQLHGEPEVADLAVMFPELTIVCSHIGDEEFLRRLAKCDNIWLDISGMAGGLMIGRLEKAVEILGIDRLLFGSDFTGYDPQAFIARVKKVIPDVQNQKKIFYDNLSDLMASVGAVI
jgi:predicted TIM-barrel fold metal-dependent hydrolase